jgi:DNA-binding GntR family transcriptional regulator
MLEPVESVDLAEQVYSRLRSAIRSGTLPPGERLVERDLAARLGVSRAPIREALQRLEDEGLIAPAGRRGKIVVTLSPHDAWEVYTLRASLEAMAVRLAVGAVATETLGNLDRIVASMRDDARRGDRDAFALHDMKFHETVCRASGHARLLRAWTAMSRQIELLYQVDTRVATEMWSDLDGVATQHERLAAAVRAGDPAEAERLVRDHIDRTAERVIESLEDSAAASSEKAGGQG